MAFQKDCGTIIIDAALTDIGRKKLVSGDLTIKGFTLGDDEIDYSIYGFPSCVADYSDILSTPLLEAYTGPQVNIQYGLKNFRSDDILYIPMLHINNKIEQVVKQYDNKFHLAVNEETVFKLKEDIGIEYILQENESVYNYILIENGIDEKAGTLPSNYKSKTSYVINYGMYDKYYYVQCDNRFIEQILVNQPTAQFENTKANKLYNTLLPLQNTKKISMRAHVENYVVYKATGIDNGVSSHAGGTDGMKYSVIQGPRSTVLALNFKCRERLVTPAGTEPDNKYVQFGHINKQPFLSNNKYDYIDTYVMVQGTVTSSQIMLPVRIIRFRS